MANKLAIVTGASTGIGFELATLAAKQGYDLIVVANEALIDAAAADFKQFGTDVQSVNADLSSIDGVDQLLDAASGRQIDLLCANAGIGTGGAFLDQDVAKWRRSVDTNITGTVYLIQRVLKDMVARDDGKILVTGSVAGYIPGAFNAVYNGTKAFVDNWTEALRNEIKESKGVTVTTLDAGTGRDRVLRSCRNERHQRRPERQQERSRHRREGRLGCVVRGQGAHCIGPVEQAAGRRDGRVAPVVRCRTASQDGRAWQRDGVKA